MAITFILDPKSFPQAPITDSKFLAILKRASIDGTRFYTFNEFYSQTVHHYRSLPFHSVIGMIVGSLVVGTLAGAFLWMTSPILGSIVGVGVTGICIRALLKSGGKSPTRAQLARAIQLWRSAKREMPTFVEQPRLHDAPPNWDEPDIYSHGVERILICERDILVDWLVLNGLHTTQNALVISESGYPNYLSDRMRELMAAEPDLPVFCLHDTTVNGESMKGRLKISPLFDLGQREVIDLGLNQDDLAAFRVPKYLRSPDFPVDSIRFHRLSPLLGLALAKKVSLSEVAPLDLSAHSDISFG